MFSQPPPPMPKVWPFPQPLPLQPLEGKKLPPNSCCLHDLSRDVRMSPYLNEKTRDHHETHLESVEKSSSKYVSVDKRISNSERIDISDDYVHKSSDDQLKNSVNSQSLANPKVENPHSRMPSSIMNENNVIDDLSKVDANKAKEGTVNKASSVTFQHFC